MTKTQNIPTQDMPDRLWQIVKNAPNPDGISTRKSTDYEARRLVHNLRLNRYPFVIATCETHEHISYWFRELDTWLAEDDTVTLPVSIRSGGHHHEAMCSNTDGVVLEATPSAHITLVDGGKYVWMGSGARLGDVIDTLGAEGRMMPTGGCRHVCVGGLAHGGGWGLSYRNKGATVDALRQVKMVLPNGDFVWIDHENFLGDTGTSLDVTAHELFWAVSGGGGGNFGMVTEFMFETYDPGPRFTTFALQFSKSTRAAAALAWTKICGKTDNSPLNSFARMLVADGEGNTTQAPAFTVGGVFYGDATSCEAALQDLLDVGPFSVSITGNLFEHPDMFTQASFLAAGAPPTDRDTGAALPLQAYTLQLGARADTSCDTPEPHKVSSAIPTGGDDAGLIGAAAEFIDQHPSRPNVNMYLSFHGMGGAAKTLPPDNASYPWRGSDYMVQAQAWWAPGSDKETENAVLAWFDGMRGVLAGYSKGAFINFPDEDQTDLSRYYGDAWGDLRGIKARVDLQNRLAFKMGIPNT